MPAARFPPPVAIQLIDDRAMVGTVQQLADRLGLSPSCIRACLKRRDALIAQTAEGLAQLLVGRVRGMTALSRRAAQDTDLRST